IVMTENVIRQCARAEADKQSQGAGVKGAGGVVSLSPSPPLSPAHRLTTEEARRIVLAACQQVGRPIFFAMAIILLAFLPVFSLTGQEGKLFHPLAFTKTFAMIGSTLLAMTLVPALCVSLVRGPYHAEDRNWIMRALLRL